MAQRSGAPDLFLSSPVTSIVIAILVVTLLLPGLALLFAIVIRFLFRGAPPPPSHDRINGEDLTRPSVERRD